MSIISSSSSRSSSSSGGRGGGDGAPSQGDLVVQLCLAGAPPRRLDALLSKDGSLPTASWRQQEAVDCGASEQSLQLASQLAGALDAALAPENGGGTGSGGRGGGADGVSIILALLHSQLPFVLQALALLRPVLLRRDPPLEARCVAREAPVLQQPKARRGVRVIAEVLFCPAVAHSEE
ncbi:hypothetical protein MNEG_7270 [Monoraphidium neglectum]|jgi:hypothetical protein|uniref:Uncharacterized protein n=1 Tax=Monoraphidium neglectum TaxID=145388 RepID=A0A0D2N3Q2_9CHLO|nr:hypothetical protein MNEG_7270 [Monoraphidium neglectum]KIZ00691.1 hypothetical protein MNEG_7270 [Monoraphidium neglectum]|eukprot:XP_013899710.1 hypothetical protein MNEG_7270 [Monoraphidium neglectum]